MKYDLIVVGGGPGGLMAAKTAAEAGMKVLLVERKKNITEINRACLQVCYVRPISPLQSGKTYMEPVTVEVQADKTIFHYQVPGCTVEYRGQLRPYLNWIQVSPSGHILHRWKPNDQVWGFFYQKEVFVAGLLGEVEKLGVTVRPETIGLGAENVQGGVRVRVSSAAGEEVLEGAAAIAADGIMSKIAESVGLNAQRKVLMANVGGVMYILEGMESPYPTCSLYGFTLPGIGDSRNIMLGLAENNGNSLFVGRTPFEKLMANPAIGPFFRKAKLVKKLAYVNDMRMPLREPVAGNVVAIGDATAPMETWIQGAVACAFQAVKAIRKELSGQPGYAEYSAWWRQAFAFNTPSYFQVGSDYYAWQRVCTDEDVDFLWTLFKDRVGIPMTLIKDNIELIKAANPVLYEKLLGANAKQAEMAKKR